MQNLYIWGCQTKDFDAFNYVTGYDEASGYTKTKVEGKYYFYEYQQKDGTPVASAIQIFRNYMNAFKNSGGEVIYSSEDNLTNFTCMFKQGDKEIWVGTDKCYDGVIDLYIIERETMKQEVSVEEMLLALNKNGYFSLYINFESGKYDIKPEFESTLNKVTILLINNPDLKISVEGHTDNVGTPESNQKLSENRAKAVYDYLVAKGIDKNRLSYTGWGQEKSIADNRSEDGRYKNRRVELVKK